jgi:hypothetical protein
MNLQNKKLFVQTLEKNRKKMYLKTLAQNTKTYGLRVAGRIAKEIFSNESSINKLIQKQQQQQQLDIQQQDQKDELEYKLKKEHGYIKGNEMFEAIVKNTSLPANSDHPAGKTSSIVQDDPNMKHPSYKSLEAKYGKETALDMIKEIQSDPDFLNKLQLSEKEDAELKPQSQNEPAKTINKDGVNWEKIGQLSHNKEHDRNNQVRISNTKGLSGQKLIDSLAHNIELDENVCV